MPVFLYQIPRLFRDGIIPLDVAIIQVSPPGRARLLSFGVETLATKGACDCAKIIIAQVNENMPRVLGDCVHPHLAGDPRSWSTQSAARARRSRAITEVEKQIAQHIAPLIPDGATLQLGIGGIPDAVLKEIDGKKDLGIHTEMVSDGVMEAIEKGIITGRPQVAPPGQGGPYFRLR